MYHRLKTPPAFWSLVLFLYADACARSGRAAEGLGAADQAIVIDDAMKHAGDGMGTPLLPEFHLLKGRLLLIVDDANGDRAEPWLLRAYEAARDLDARLPQLRAAIGLCRAEAKHGDPECGRGLLSTTYATFTEGFTTVDLIEARDLLLPDGTRAAIGSHS